MWKNIYNSFNMCLSMFTIIPTFKYKWDEKLRFNMLLYLPIIGLIIGVLWQIFYILLNLISESLHIKNFIFIEAFLLSIFVNFISGFIHVDGFMDVVDAICSRKDKEDRKKILKDSHIGSFASIHFTLLSIINFVSILTILASGVKGISIVFCFIPFFSRLMSNLLINLFDKISESEYNIYLDEESKKTKNKLIIAQTLSLSILGLVVLSLSNIKFLIIIFALIISHFISMVICKNSFGGVNGDSSGFAIEVSESVALLTMAIILNI